MKPTSRADLPSDSASASGDAPRRDSESPELGERGADRTADADADALSSDTSSEFEGESSLGVSGAIVDPDLPAAAGAATGRAARKPAAITRKKRRRRLGAQASEATVMDEAELERRPRRALAIGGVLLALGLAIVGVGPSDLGTGITIVALVTLIYGVHTFGRLGPSGSGSSNAPLGA